MAKKLNKKISLNQTEYKVIEGLITAKVDKKAELKLDFSHKSKSRNFRFGLFAADKKDPKDESKNLRLTYDQKGE